MFRHHYTRVYVISYEGAFKEVAGRKSSSVICASMAASPETLPGNPGGSIIFASAAACYCKHYVPARSISPEVAVSEAVHQSKPGASNRKHICVV